MFWRKKKEEAPQATPQEAPPATPKEAPPAAPQVKYETLAAEVGEVQAAGAKESAKPTGKVKPKEVVLQELEQLAPGQELKHRIQTRFSDYIAFVEFNPGYPKKGKKYLLSVQDLENGKPVGQKRLTDQSDNLKYIVNWIIDNLDDTAVVPPRL